jgi:hypothetical protein
MLPLNDVPKKGYIISAPKCNLPDAGKIVVIRADFGVLEGSGRGLLPPKKDFKCIVAPCGKIGKPRGVGGGRR